MVLPGKIPAMKFFSTELRDNDETLCFCFMQIPVPANRP
jgi:hypothetical protein